MQDATLLININKTLLTARQQIGRGWIYVVALIFWLFECLIVTSWLCVNKAVQTRYVHVIKRKDDVMISMWPLSRIYHRWRCCERASCSNLAVFTLISLRACASNDSMPHLGNQQQGKYTHKVGPRIHCHVPGKWKDTADTGTIYQFKSRYFTNQALKGQ